MRLLVKNDWLKGKKPLSAAQCQKRVFASTFASTEARTLAGRDASFCPCHPGYALLHRLLVSGPVVCLVQNSCIFLAVEHVNLIHYMQFTIHAFMYCSLACSFSICSSSPVNPASLISNQTLAQCRVLACQSPTIVQPFHVNKLSCLS